MDNKMKLLKMTTTGLLIAIGVVISPLLRVEGMCPMAHLINITAAVLMGPWYALLIATIIGIIRMTTMGIPPLALTGAVFGAFLSGMFYRMSHGKLIATFLGEVFGTGIVGAIVSYPVMYYLIGRSGLTWFFYIPSFIAGTLIGGSLAFVFLRSLAHSGQLSKMQEALGTHTYPVSSDLLSNCVGIMAFGFIAYLVSLVLLKMLLKITAPWASVVPFVLLGTFVLAAVGYFAKERMAVK